MAAGKMSFATVFAAAVNSGCTRRTVSPVPVIAAEVKMVYSALPLGDTPAMVKTTDGVNDAAVQLIKNNPAIDGQGIVAVVVAVRAALVKIVWLFFISFTFYKTAPKGRP